MHEHRVVLDRMVAVALEGGAKLAAGHMALATGRLVAAECDPQLPTVRPTAHAREARRALECDGDMDTNGEALIPQGEGA